MTEEQKIKSEASIFWSKIADIELAERIVIDYANLSGRETANRAEFRERVLNHLFRSQSSLLERIEKLKWERDESGTQHMYNTGVQVRNSTLEDIINLIKEGKE